MRFKWPTVGLVVAAVAGGLLLAVAFTAKPAADHPFFATESGAQVIAHRGGSVLRPEGTLIAFIHTAEIGGDILEMDVHRAADSAIVVIHDATVDRTTDGTGRIDSMKLAALRELDAGYRWSADGGKTYPYRGTGVKIPLLDEVFARFPSMRMNIEIKSPDTRLSQLLCALIRQRDMSQKILVASFHSEAMSVFRKECPEVATSMTATEARVFYALYFVGLSGTYSPDAQALQTPYRIGERIIATPDFIQAARRRNLKIHVWTINDEIRMRELVATGINGIITDRPDLLLKVLGRGKSN